MSYSDAPHFSGPLGQLNVPAFGADPSNTVNTVPDNRSKNPRLRQSSSTQFHGEALARDAWGERSAPWIVLIFAAGFSLFLIFMVLFGQTPGKSFFLKGASDIFQFVGEGMGFIFCTRIALRLRTVALQLRRALLQTTNERRSPNEIAIAHAEAQAAQRAFYAWGALAIGIALYASGQAIWTSYDIRMNSADVPFPGLYDIGFVLSYPFFLLGTLLLTRRNKASVGRVRLLLDSLAFIGAALAISWFFLLSPLIAGLAQAPSTGAAFLSIYFPTGDLFLVAVGAFLMFSPLANRMQQSVFMLLCMGLFFLAITDSLLAFYSLSGSFNTGTVQDVLWPLSMALIGLAAIEYPRSIAREQEQEERTKNSGRTIPSLILPGRWAQFSTTAQTIAPFILVIGTCALLLTNVTTRGGSTIIQADLVALALILIVIVRQALTLLENNRLTMQMRGELVISRRELQVTRREADEATRSAQEKQIMEQGIATLREVHARVARGDISARAPTIPGPLLPIAISLNLMLDRISALSQRGAKYDQLLQDSKMLQAGVERLGQGQIPWSSEQQPPRSAAELHSIFMGIAHLHRMQTSQWNRFGGAIEYMRNLTRRIRESLFEFKQTSAITDLHPGSYERMSLDRMLREIDLLLQQQRSVLSQVTQVAQSAHSSTRSMTPQVAQEPFPEQAFLKSPSQHLRSEDAEYIMNEIDGYRPEPIFQPIQDLEHDSYRQRMHQTQRSYQLPFTD
ncbi:hypothetical protein [Tengunoibacter tsumagoiensis]|uniref:HAMP domain-containing protein n=1 Tax=Tengunoibacter tsumagoiensis TaxID=2014871 RepID=A0A402AAL5_9CHLR|nr:hypothetical protein [Tengunoibacter tsumagoiensis]GCE16159.1 hypothetical protein KTT_60180 [Tengunoibacter tsumagoiensis]